MLVKLQQRKFSNRTLRNWKTCLIIDLDPQGNASTGLGVPVNNRKPGAYEVLSEKISMADTVKSTDVNGLGLVPSMVNLSMSSR